MRKLGLMAAVAISMGLSPLTGHAQFGTGGNPFEQFRPTSFAPQRGGESEAPSEKPAAKEDSRLQNYGEKLFGTETGVRSADYSSAEPKQGVTPTSATGPSGEAMQEFSGRVSLPAPTERRGTTAAPAGSLLNSGPSLTDPVATSGTSIRPGAIKNAAPTDLKAEWKAQTALNVGQECKCSLVVTNSGKGTASDVTVETHFPTSARLISAEPKPSATSSFLSWSIGTLGAGQSKTIEVVFVPSAQGQFQPTAHVRHTSTAVAGFSVLQPMLTLTVDGPSEVYAGDPASQVVTITNPGSGVATNVILEAVIPQGLEHARGGKLRTELGNLNPGETRSVRLALAAVAGGNHVLQVGAKADFGLAQASAAKINVIAPSLASKIEGPGLRYLGREAEYTITVANDGAASTDNVRVMHKLPAGFDYVKSSRGAKYDANSRIVSWFVGRLDRGQSVNLGLVLTATKAGDFVHNVRATSDQGVISDSAVSTRVEGVSALALSVRDLDDPVEVGKEAAYEIEIKNEGSAPATNVTLACELPAGTEFKSAKGPSRHAVAAGKILFQPLPAIAPGQSVTFTLQAAGKQAGMKRFRATIASDATESLISEELTRFYGE